MAYLVHIGTREIDELNRVLLPRDAMERLGCEKGDIVAVYFDIESQGVVLKLAEKYTGPKCLFCEAAETAMSINHSDICRSCVEKIKTIMETS